MTDSKMTISQIINSLNAFGPEELTTINKALIAISKAKRQVKAVVTGAQFRIGDIVSFNAKTRGFKTIMIEKFNRAGTAVVGYECTADGKLLSGPQWTVSNNLCKKVN